MEEKDKQQMIGMFKYIVEEEFAKIAHTPEDKILVLELLQATIKESLEALRK